MEELIQAQQEYIDFLSISYDEAFGQAALYGYQCKPEYVLQGFILREKIKDLEDKIK
jgi:hypothetical protein